MAVVVVVVQKLLLAWERWRTRLCWAAVLFLPSLLLFQSGFGKANLSTAACSMWTVAIAVVLLPPRILALATFPVAVCGALLVGADRLASVDALELAAVWYTFTLDEVLAALSPFATFIALGVFAIGGVALWVARGKPFRPRLFVLASLLFSGAVLAAFIPAATWLRSWPLAIADAVVAALQDTSDVLDGGRRPRNARDAMATWQAARKDLPGRETYVLVVGESMRADALSDCGGSPRIRPLAADAVVLCDVLSGANNTHTSVPLLISREPPGAAAAALRDATFLHAFAEVGFGTYWLSNQEKSIAFPDARSQSFNAYSTGDSQFLVPALKRALGRSDEKKAIVLHAMNAHIPYTRRYARENAVFDVDEAALETEVGEQRKAYGNAIHESVGFLNDVIETLRNAEGEVFLMMSADHGENFKDDSRGLLVHALKRPTIWDTRVPGVIWANAAWKNAHPVAWKRLVANRKMPLMHMDFVPTLLGAAAITYADRRSEALDLTKYPVPANRLRYTQWGANRTALEAELRSEAGMTIVPLATGGGAQDVH